MRTYYILAVRDSVNHPFGIEWGNYDLDELQIERATRLECPLLNASNHKIIKVNNDSQAACDAAIIALNARTEAHKADCATIATVQS